MYGLLLAITTKGVALGVTVLNRLTITAVEGLLLLAAALAWRFLPRPEPETDPLTALKICPLTRANFGPLKIRRAGCAFVHSTV